MSCNYLLSGSVGFEIEVAFKSRFGKQVQRLALSRRDLGRQSTVRLVMNVVVDLWNIVRVGGTAFDAYLQREPAMVTSYEECTKLVCKLALP